MQRLHQLKKGLIINNPQRRLPKEQRKLFEDNGWQIVDSAQPAHNEPPALCYSSVWLSMNVLSLDPKTVCVEKSEVYQAEQLDKLRNGSYSSRVKRCICIWWWSSLLYCRCL